MTEEFEYVMVESGQAPTSENNLLTNPVFLSTGEANFTNQELQSFGLTQIYLKLEKDSEDGE